MTLSCYPTRSIKNRVKVNHEIALMHTRRKRFEFLVRCTFRVVVVKVRLADERRHHSDRVTLCALVFGEGLACLHREDVGRAVLEGGSRGSC